MQLCTEMAYRATRAGGSKAYRSSVLYSHYSTEFGFVSARGAQKVCMQIIGYPSGSNTR